MILAALEYDVGGKSVMVPLQGEEPGDGLRRRGANIPGDQVQHEIVPGHRCARGHELLAFPGDDEDALGLQGNAREHARERIGIAPVDRRLPAVEQTGFGEQEHPRARRAEQRALVMHSRGPFDKPWVAPDLPAVGSEQDGRDDDDVRCRDLRAAAAGLDRDTAGERDPAGGRADDLDPERRLGRDRGIQAGQQPERVQDIVDAGQRRDDGIGYGDQADVEGRRTSEHGGPVA